MAFENSRHDDDAGAAVDPSSLLAMRSVPELISDVRDALKPFAEFYARLPLDIRNNPDQNLGDVIGIFNGDGGQLLTVGHLLDLAGAFCIVDPNASMPDVKREPRHDDDA